MLNSQSTSISVALHCPWYLLVLSPALRDHLQPSHDVSCLAQLSFPDLKCPLQSSDAANSYGLLATGMCKLPSGSMSSGAASSEKDPLRVLQDCKLKHSKWGCFGDALQKCICELKETDNVDTACTPSVSAARHRRRWYRLYILCLLLADRAPRNSQESPWVRRAVTHGAARHCDF